MALHGQNRHGISPSGSLWVPAPLCLSMGRTTSPLGREGQDAQGRRSRSRCASGEGESGEPRDGSPGCRVRHGCPAPTSHLESRVRLRGWGHPPGQPLRCRLCRGGAERETPPSTVPIPPCQPSSPRAPCPSWAAPRSPRGDQDPSTTLICRNSSSSALPSKTSGVTMGRCC